ncbi:HepT-like ribonuclease domain-containing protein [Maribellus mangrovi]|uniref:HepT-like ribonuclease domain-containing protein n=1 Tax=Maribellus mangrovi TaxID=3133146 RepID=UPI0030EB6B5A
MFDKILAFDLITLIEDNLNTVRQRTRSVTSSDDFTSSEAGMILLDSVCMKLVAVGESIKNLDKVSNKELLPKYPQIQWKQAMGMRDIIVHHYFDVDAEQIFNTLREDIPLLLSVLATIKSDLKKNK